MCCLHDRELEIDAHELTSENRHLFKAAKKSSSIAIRKIASWALGSPKKARNLSYIAWQELFDSDQKVRLHSPH